MAINLGSAYVDIVPSTSNLAPKVRGELEPALEAAGKSSGQKFSSRFSQGISSLASSVSSTLTTVVTGAATAAGAVGAAALVKGFSRLTTLQDATSALTISLGSSADAAELLSKVLGVVKGTPFNFDQFAAAAQQLVGFGIDAQKVPGYLTAIGEASATQGKRAGEFADRLSTVFGQIAATGQVNLGQVWQISETGVNALAILANGFGVTRDAMKDMISAGAVPAGKALDILSKGITDGSTGLAGTTVAFGGTMAALRQTLTGAEGGFGAGLARFGASVITPFTSLLTDGFTTATAVLDGIGPRIGAALQRIVDSPAAKNLAAWLADVPSKIGPALDRLKELAPVLAPIAAGIGALAFNNLGGALGPLGALLPKLSPVLAVFGAIVAMSPELQAALGDLATVIAQGLGDAFTTIAQALAPVLPDIAAALAEVAKAVGDVAAQLIPLLPGLAELAVTLIERLGVPGIKAIAGALEVVATVLADLAPVLPAIVDLVLALVVGFKAYKAALVVASAAQLAFNTVMEANPVFLVVGALAALGIAIFEAYKHFQPFHDAVDKVWQLLQTAFHWVADNWPLLLEILTGPIGLAVGFIVDHFNGIVDFIKGIPGRIRDALSGMWDFITDQLSMAKDWWVQRFNDLVGFVKGLPGQLASAAHGLWDWIVGGLEDLVKRAIRFLAPLINAVIHVINAALRAYDALPGDQHITTLHTIDPDSLFDSGVAVTPKGNIPTRGDLEGLRLASGGLIKHRLGGVFANIGEGGSDEAVLPLDRLQPMIDRAVIRSVNAYSIPAPRTDRLVVDVTGADNDLVRLVQKWMRTQGSGALRPVR